MHSSKQPYSLFTMILLSAAQLLAAASDSKPVNALPSPVGSPETSFTRPAPDTAGDPCLDPELQANSISPTWNRQAGTVQCGALETDNMAVLQPMENGVSQWTVGTTAKYGLTRRLELRWGLPGRTYQGMPGTARITGTTDPWLGTLFHFHDQHRWVPDLALDYAFKIPTANPAKGFGTGYGDHVLSFIASRDVGARHIDFNAVGTLAGARGGYDGAAQAGLGFFTQFPSSSVGTIESFGGSQLGTRDRYGALLLGASWGLRPSLALNGGIIRSYTADCPRALYMLGFIYTVRPGFAPPPESALSRLLGR